jgi:hypothetical protein
VLAIEVASLVATLVIVEAGKAPSPMSVDSREDSCLDSLQICSPSRRQLAWDAFIYALLRTENSLWLARLRYSCHSRKMREGGTC